MTILAIETSCDETGAAVVEGCGNRVKIFSNAVGSQIKIHQRYGGVVPELAARRHAEMIVSVIEKALNQAFPNYDGDAQIFAKNIDAIAVTNAPGLIIALLVGLEAAKSLAFAWSKPLIGVNHLEGHIYSVLAESGIQDASFFNSPSLALIVSGGHTELILIHKYGDYQVLGRTRDDAAGEAFDKAAKILSLPYPGGPAISKAAIEGLADAHKMPLAMLNSKDFDFSFAGIKTHVLNLVKELKRGSVPFIANIAASFQEAICDILVAKTIAAALHHRIKSIIITGGVSANTRLREKFQEAAQIENLNCHFPSLELSGDNAAMIGIAGYLKARSNKFDDIFKLKAMPKIKW
ncbi:MAG: tRNA (adenosine(37)-N6)-threonylcarbamoyltransferase complex transferase subunit TsaD [Patescibacteria group bacterium]